MKLRLFPINIALVGTITFLGWDTLNTWRLSTDIPVEESISITIKAKEEEKEEKEEKQKKKRKLLRHYAMIGKKSLFRPEREEWKPPPPPPPEPKPKDPPPPVEEKPPPPPPLPDPVLDGIIIISETNRIALMKGSSRESSTPSASAPKTRFRTRGRSRRSSRNVPRPGRIITGEVKRYRLGDEISEMVIENILDDRVVLKRKNGEKVEVFLRTAEKTTKQVATSIKNKKKPPTRRTEARKPGAKKTNRFRRRSSRSPRRIGRTNAKDLLKAVEP